MAVKVVDNNDTYVKCLNIEDNLFRTKKLL